MCEMPVQRCFRFASQRAARALPLASATLATPDVALVQPHIDILRDEVNVKSVDLTDRVADHGTEELVLLPKARAAFGWQYPEGNRCS